MKKSLRGFTFIEIILYIGLFALLGTALSTFAWDMLKLSREGNTERLVTDEARFALERMKYEMRKASGINSDSIFNDTNGKLILEEFGRSETLTFELQNGQLVMQGSGRNAVALHTGDIRVITLHFERLTAPDQSVDFVKAMVTFETAATAPLEYASSITLETGVTLRNMGL